MKKIMGVFQYDLFPGMVVLDITGWNEDGDVLIGNGYCIKTSALIAVFPKKQGMVIEQCLQTIKTKYKQQVNKLQKELLENLFKKFPTLQKEMINV